SSRSPPSVCLVLTSAAVLFVTDLFHPVNRLTVKLLLDGDMCHGCGGRGAMPMLLTGRDPDYVARLDFFNRSAPALHSAACRDHDQGLAQRVGVPGSPSARLECYASALNTRWFRRLKKWIDTNGSGKPLCRALRGRLRAGSFDLHILSSLRFLIAGRICRFVELDGLHSR